MRALLLKRPKRALRRGKNKIEERLRSDNHSIADSAVEAEARLASIEGSIHGVDRATINSQNAEDDGKKENSVSIAVSRHALQCGQTS